MNGPSRFRSLPKPALTSEQLTLLLAVALVLVYNVSFWSRVLAVRGTAGVWNVGFLLSLFALLVAALNVLLSLAAFKYVQKVVAVFLLTTAAIAAYFMNTYGALLDRTMMQNTFESDPGEIRDLLSLRLVLYALLLGVVPSVLVCRLRVRYRPWLRQIAVGLAGAVLSVVVMGVAALSFSADYASLMRNHRELRHLIAPVNYLSATASYVSRSVRPRPATVQPLGADARIAGRKSEESRNALFVLVVGEAARAMSFSLQGYARETNPGLSRERVLVFDDVTSCGTSTAVSLPCMFSDLGRKHFDDFQARNREGLLDVLAHAGVRVLWRDNNSGCKGACDRVEHQDRTQIWTAGHCDEAGCFDEALLDGLGDWVDATDGDAVVVLHQKGSHGPAYYKDYPPEFERFTPVCKGNQLGDCSREQIVNTYDNTILYTDHFLTRVIGFLKERAGRYDTAMLYVSDHGESLGENKLYLHGLPMALAPDEQTHVPLIVWLSEEFERGFGVDVECLSRRRDAPLAHDNLFHSVLGLLNVETEVYEAALDLFAPCRAPAP